MEEQVFFHCDQAIWYKDTAMGIFDPNERVQFQDWIGHRGRLRVGTELPQATRYAYLVDHFSSLQMTHQDDAVNGFRGILNHFNPLFSPSFACGLPESLTMASYGV